MSSTGGRPSPPARLLRRAGSYETIDQMRRRERIRNAAAKAQAERKREVVVFERGLEDYALWYFGSKNRQIIEEASDLDVKQWKRYKSCVPFIRQASFSPLFG